MSFCEKMSTGKEKKDLSYKVVSRVNAQRGQTAQGVRRKVNAWERREGISPADHWGMYRSLKPRSALGAWHAPLPWMPEFVS